MERSAGTFVGTLCGDIISQGSTSCDLRPRSLPPKLTKVDGLQIGFICLPLTERMFIYELGP